MDVAGWQVKTKSYDPQLPAGERLQFELRANPVTSRPGDALLNADGSPMQRTTGKQMGAARHKVVRHDVVMDAKKQLLAERGLSQWQDWQAQDKPLLYELARRACGKWLVEQGHRRGFEVNEATLQVDVYTQHRGKDDKLRFSSVDFAGELTVLEPTEFSKALTLGVGHAKAFGCGLLLVRLVG